MTTNRRNKHSSSSASDPAVSGVVISGSAQTFSPTGRWIVVSTAGTVTGKLLDDAVDVAYVLPVGVHRMAFKSITSTSSLVGVILT